MITPFVILGSPRSRTAWLAEFLSWGGWTVHHEPSVHFKHISDIKPFLIPNVGIVDSMLTLRWRDILRIRPDTRIAIVWRPQRDVLTSVSKIAPGADLEPVAAILGLLWAEVQAMRQEIDVPLFLFDDLRRRGTMDTLERYCTQRSTGSKRWREWKDINIQKNLGHTSEIMQANIEGVMRVFPEIKSLGD